jgi:hypothetical protein
MLALRDCNVPIRISISLGCYYIMKFRALKFAFLKSCFKTQFVPVIVVEFLCVLLKVRKVEKLV